MIHFFRDILDGPLYIGITILSIIFIMAIIGFLMERKKFEKEEKQKIAVVSDTRTVTPITPVTVSQQTPSMNQNTNFNHSEKVTNSSLEVKTPIVVFDDSNQKQE